MNYKDIIAKTLLNKTSTEINIHPMNKHFILEVNYEVIVNAIVDDLESNGYTINKQQ
jgi:hypothetical protein